MKDEKFIENWEKDRRSGKRKYVLFHAILMGIASSVGYTISLLTKKNPHGLFAEYYITMYLTYFIGAFTAGAIGAYIRWKLNEEKYYQLINKDSCE